MKFKASFRRSLTLNFIAVSALPILSLGLFGIQYFEHKQLQTASSLLDSHLLAVSHEATEFILYTAASLTLVEKTLRSGLLHNDAEINQLLQMAINPSNSFVSLSLLDEDHRVTHVRMSGSNKGSVDDLMWGWTFSHTSFFLIGPSFAN